MKLESKDITKLTKANCALILRDRRHFLGKPILITLVQLVIGILYGLGLDRPPAKDPATALINDIKGKYIGTSKLRTLEERRILLGCFFMSSVLVYVSSLLKT